MSCRKANIQSANPPSHPEPDISAIPKLHKSKEYAEKEPTKQHDQSSLKKHSLRLRDLPDGIKGEYDLWETNSRVLEPACSNGRSTAENNTAVAGSIEKLPWWACTEAAIVAEAIAWT